MNSYKVVFILQLAMIFVGCRSMTVYKEALDRHNEACRLYQSGLSGKEQDLCKAILIWSDIYENYWFYHDESRLARDYNFKQRVLLNLATVCYEFGRRKGDRELVAYANFVLKDDLKHEYEEEERLSSSTSLSLSDFSFEEDGEIFVVGRYSSDELEQKKEEKQKLFRELPETEWRPRRDYEQDVPVGALRGLATICLSPLNALRILTKDSAKSLFIGGVIVSSFSMCGDVLIGGIDFLTLGAAGNEIYIDGYTPWFWERGNEIGDRWFRRRLDVRIEHGL